MQHWLNPGSGFVTSAIYRSASFLSKNSEISYVVCVVQIFDLFHNNLKFLDLKILSCTYGKFWRLFGHFLKNLEICIKSLFQSQEHISFGFAALFRTGLKIDCHFYERPLVLSTGRWDWGGKVWGGVQGRGQGAQAYRTIVTTLKV